MYSQNNGSAAALAPVANTQRLQQVRVFPPKPIRLRPGAARGLPCPLIVLSPFGEDFLALLDILRLSEWAVYWSSDYAEAMNMLHRNSIPVVLCERELPDDQWRRLAAEAQSLPEPPRIILTALLADDHLWVEALNLGVHDVLRRPFEPAEVIRVVSYAREFWSAMRQRRQRNANRPKRV